MPARRRADRHLVHHMDKKGGQFSRIDLSQRIAMLAEPDKQVRCRATRRARPKRIAAQGFASRDQHLDKRRSEEHTSELQSLMRISYAVFCLKKTKTTQDTQKTANSKPQI